MKKYIYAIIMVSSVLSAQEFKGIAVYESKSNPKVHIPGESGDSPEMKSIKEQLARSFEKTIVLKFDKSASLYEEQQKLELPSQNQGPVQIRISPMGLLYKNLKEKYALLETELFSKEFLVSDSLKNWNWKLLPDTKKIGNYICYKAVSVQKITGPVKKDDPSVTILDAGRPKEIIITAWYTPDVAVGHGPGKYWGLPGLILEVNDGETMILCSKLTLNPKEKFEIRIPKKGEKVTKAEVEKIIDKKTQEVMDMNSGPGSTTKVIKVGG